MFFHARTARFSRATSRWRFIATATVLIHACVVLGAFPLAAGVLGGVATDLASPAAAVSILLAALVMALALWLATSRYAPTAEEPTGEFPPALTPVRRLLSPVGMSEVSLALIVAGVTGLACSLLGGPLAAIGFWFSMDVAVLGLLSVGDDVPAVTRRTIELVPVDTESTLVLPTVPETTFTWTPEDPFGVLGRTPRRSFEIRQRLSRSRFAVAESTPRECRLPADLIRLVRIDRNPDIRDVSEAIVRASTDAGMGPFQTIVNVCSFATGFPRIVEMDRRGRPAGTYCRTPTEVLVLQEGELLDFVLLAYALLERTRTPAAVFWRPSLVGGLHGRIAIGLVAPARFGGTAADLRTGTTYLLLEPSPRRSTSVDAADAGWRWSGVVPADAVGFERVTP